MVRVLRTPINEMTVQNYSRRVDRFSSQSLNQNCGVCYALKLAGIWWWVSPPRAKRVGRKMLLTFRLNRRDFTVWLRDSSKLRVVQCPYYWNLYND